jgi:hypothetical protein
MLRARDLLARFRPVGAPGAAAPAGVPADRVAELSRELQPVFEELAEVRQRCVELRAAAAADARARAEQGAARARAIVAEGRLDAEAQRAEAATRVREGAERESAETLIAAEREAVEIRRRLAERLDGHVALVVAALLRTIDAEPVDGRVR